MTALPEPFAAVRYPHDLGPEYVSVDLGDVATGLALDADDADALAAWLTQVTEDDTNPIAAALTEAARLARKAASR